jgi:Putative Flp pilus-assembly TadE/G-like
MERDRGTITIWTLGMILVVSFLGWLSLGLWSVFAERRDLAAAADQAAQSGATALDVQEFRTTGGTVLDPTLAEQRALDSLTQQNLGPITNIYIQATTEQIVVTLETHVELGLLSVLTNDDEPLHIRVTAIAGARE